MTWNTARSALGSASTSHRPFGERPLGPFPYSAADAHRPVSCTVRAVLPVRASITRTAVLPELSTSLAKATVHPGAPITRPRSAVTWPLASMTFVPSAPLRTRASLVRVGAADADGAGVWSRLALPQ